MATQVTMIETGVANVASVRAAFGRLDAELTPARGADDILVFGGGIVPDQFPPRDTRPGIAFSGQHRQPAAAHVR